MCNADNTNNKKYWNDYVTYWETRVESANDGSEKKDKTPDDILLEHYFNLLSVKETDVFLDFGCGSGRLFPIFENRTGTGGNYMGIDISRVSLEHAQERFPRLRINERLFEYDGLAVPFENNSFDKIVSFGVFDACSQEEILIPAKWSGIHAARGAHTTPSVRACCGQGITPEICSEISVPSAREIQESALIWIV